MGLEEWIAEKLHGWGLMKTESEEYHEATDWFDTPLSRERDRFFDEAEKLTADFIRDGVGNPEMAKTKASEEVVRRRKAKVAEPSGGI